MNRFLFGGCLIVLFGCGARTESFTDLDGAGAQFPGAGGASATAGATHTGGVTHSAGAPGIAGAANGTAGTTGGAGAPNVAGAPGVGGVPNVAGAPGTAGSGATAGIIEACQVIAGNSCQQCLCTSCSMQIVECFSNFGCALILACAQQTGCQGVACYSAQTCKPVIDQFGGLGGKSMKDVLSLLTCSVGSQNNCNCN